MPMFKADAVVFTVEEKGTQINNMLERFQRGEMMAAMGMFLRAALKKIPVRTGFLLSAFRPLKQQFMRETGADLNPGLTELLLKSEAHREAAVDYFAWKRTVNTKGEKLSPKLIEKREKQYEREARSNHRRWRKTKGGRAAGTDHRFEEYYYYSKRRRVLKTPANARKFVTPQDGGDVLRIMDDKSTLQFDINIAYYRINDNFSRIAGSPWRSMDTGLQAMLNYLENAASRFPYINEIMVASRIYLRGENVGKKKGPNNMAADYRGTVGTVKWDPLSGNIRGAKMTPYPAGSTKPQLYGLGDRFEYMGGGN